MKRGNGAWSTWSDLELGAVWSALWHLEYDNDDAIELAELEQADD